MYLAGMTRAGPAPIPGTETALPLVLYQAMAMMRKMENEPGTALRVSKQGRVVPVGRGVFRCIVCAFSVIMFSSARAVPVSVRTL